jgi:urea transport system ATP-binding protein
MLEINDITLKYGQSQILNGISMSAQLGKITAVMGTNGVGKTSLLKAIAGRHPISGGTIKLDGNSLPKHTAFAAAKAGIAYVPQGREVFPMMTVTENLETGFACLDGGGHTIPDHIYELFPVLHDMSNRRGGDLSGGQQQQLAIARALITKPKVLLLDEPTEGIQPNVIQHIGRVIETLRDQGEIAIVLVEQFFDFAFELGDQFITMNTGQVTLDQPAENVERDELLKLVSV